MLLKLFKYLVLAVSLNEKWDIKVDKSLLANLDLFYLLRSFFFFPDGKGTEVDTLC